MRKLFIVAVILLVCTSVHCCVYAGTLTATVTWISDGDTIKLGSTRVRLYGVDSPEKGQPYGKAALNFMIRKLKNKKVTIDVLYKDKYGVKICVGK